MAAMTALSSGNSIELAIEHEPARAAPLTIEEVFARYHRYVAAIGARLLGRDHELDDLVQDVFIAAMRGLRDRDRPEAVKGWLAIVTVRCARRRLRARKVRAWFGLDEGTANDVGTGGCSPEQRAQLSEVYAALDRLAPDVRIAWTLRYVEGEQLESIAALCECSLATAKRRIAAGQEQIERALGHE